MDLTPGLSATRRGEPERAEAGESAGESIGAGRTGETRLAPTSGQQCSQARTGSLVYAEYPHDAIWDALREVSDPELGISLVDMGLVVAARLEDGTARLTLTYTAMGCPAMEMIEDDVRERLLRVPGVHSVELETVWTPVWTKARLTERGRDELLLSGVAV